ncbi:LOW QUALITY PROTEIN: Hypothetical protein PHPALM_16068 [Phytophthora palmivora]|uniref:EGF-like domain-containing protein n=1 Tax=Phytophthora palmivora TaxID=4796 RepID=A0A2P4XQL6_9STRA|nr:LOW QUALITY PROTEIN: Hypothetical protein PHPALM_16068 [Phytophthora palmivora]
MPGYRSSDGYGNPGTRGDCGCANDQNLYGGPIESCGNLLAVVMVTARVHRRSNAFAKKDGQLEIARHGNARQGHHGLPHHQQVILCTISGRHALMQALVTARAWHVREILFAVVTGNADADSPSLQFDYGTDPNNIQTFDRDSILGCKCDRGYEGYDCSKRSCTKGDDPVTTDQVDEIQVLKCTATGGFFRLQYRTSTSTRIPFDATSISLRNILMTSFGFEDPVVEYSFGTKACSAPASTPNIITVTFPVDHGDFPPLRVVATSLTALSGAVNFATADNGVAIDGVISQKGTKENAVCSNSSCCDYSLGKYSCSFGYGTSDGRGKPRDRDDCGRILPEA